MHETFLVFWFVSQVEKGQHWDNIMFCRGSYYFLWNITVLKDSKVIFQSKQWLPLQNMMLPFFNLGNKTKQKRGFVIRTKPVFVSALWTGAWVKTGKNTLWSRMVPTNCNTRKNKIKDIFPMNIYSAFFFTCKFYFSRAPPISWVSFTRLGWNFSGMCPKLYPPCMQSFSQIG